MEHVLRFALVGPGRAGTALGTALVRAGWVAVSVSGRRSDNRSVVTAAERLGARPVEVQRAGEGADLVLLATPDDVLSRTAEEIAGSLAAGALVVHMAGSVGLEVFSALSTVRTDVRTGAAHPLQTLAGGPGDADLLRGAWFAVEGDSGTLDIVDAVGGRAFHVGDRAAYHAAACVGSNHVVALLGQLERLAAMAGIPAEAFHPLVDAAIANVRERGAEAALTGPVARGDVETVARHLEALPASEQRAYRALASEALRLSDRVDPDLEVLLAEPHPADAMNERALS